MKAGRIAALDVLRGVAILGTFGTNVWIFTSPAGVAAIFAPGSAVETGLRMLSNGKFLSLLSIMFGIGLALQHASAQRRGARWPGWYLWRSALLFVEGTLHYVLVFEFDVLMFYALVSVLVAFLVGRGARVRRGWMIAAGTVHVLFVGFITAGLLTGHADLGTGKPVDTSSWPAQVLARVEYASTYRAEAVFVLPLSLVLFLAGAWLLRSGALENSARGTALRRRLMAWGFGVGVPLNVITAYAGVEWAMVERYVCAPIVAFGLLGGITALVLRMRDEAGPVRTGLTAIGRCALSCYILQNLVASVLCYRWGLGLTGGPLWTVGCFLLVSALMMAGACWWIGRFPRGPVETAWDWAYRLPRWSTRVGTASPVGPAG
ncbi:DUF418 domain-containing protein [Actinokineospora enzanensis]|uniref:DUF418 domain-containing protein n=1 Tax=Actinokineospora enzanensis TaxID=155975 RepID=UPI00037B08DC|nr:DUF418 domain-containing protein [Actinokineospora enzanensis]